MADKRISQLIERVDIANNDVLPIVASGATTTNKVTISTIQEWMQDNLDVGVTSVGITLGSTGTDVNVTGSPITTSGNITINIPTASATNRGLLSSSDWNTFTNQRVPYTGATGNVNLGEYGISSGFVTLDTTPTGTPGTQGTIYWDDSRSTAALIMNGTTQHIGQDTFFYVKNSTGSTIPKGTGVGFAGTDGASGHLLIQPFLANGSQPSTYFMGVTAEAITNGSFGQVMQFGELSGVNTSGYTAGALLYASTSVAGAFQTTAPQAPNNIILVAAAVNSTNNGSIIVRPQIGSNINNDEGVKITSVADKDLLQYQSGTGLWENKTRENAGVVTTDTSQAITATKQFTQGLSLGSAGGTNQLTVVKNIGTLHEGSASVNQIGFNSGNNIYFGKGLNNGGVISWNNAAVRYYTLPDADGTIALTSDLGNYVTIGTTQTITGSKTISNATTTYMDLNSTNASGASLNFQRNGVNMGHIGNSGVLGVGVLDDLEVRAGSTRALHLKTDGGQLTLASGGSVTLTGALNGTSASFTGGITANQSVFTHASTPIRLNNLGGRFTQLDFLNNNTQKGAIWWDNTANSLNLWTGTTSLTLASTGAATFSSSVNIASTTTIGGVDGSFLRTYSATNDALRWAFINSSTGIFSIQQQGDGYANQGDRLVINRSGNVGIGTASNIYGKLSVEASGNHITMRAPAATAGKYWALDVSSANQFYLINNTGSQYLTITDTGAATFSSSVSGTSIRNSSVGSFGFNTANNGEFQIYATAANGMIMAGRGSSTDMVITNKSGTDVFTIPTGTTIANFTGNVGIGTASPTGQSADNRVIQIYGAGVANRAQIHFVNADTGETSTDGSFIGIDSFRELFIINRENAATVFENNGSERMRITSGGDVLTGGTTNNNPAESNVPGASLYRDGRLFISATGTEVIRVNRGSNDGVLVFFHQDGVAEGSINVSGTTVSYNGGHLSRWSQTESNDRIEGIVKGTVMSNIDQMAVWINPETGEPYPNEQLNCMKISDVEGDKNVAGVFVDWDNDDKVYTNDMNIAMTGDMIIRIAEGVLVEKGDLLISAGDGTAKPQSDDLIRSNTIAKVTSNHVTCIYEDGSYCVPCVLMAC